MKFSDSKVYCVSQRKCVAPAVFLLLVFGGIVMGTAFICTADNPDFFYRLLFTHNIFKTKTDLSFINLFLRNLLPVLFILAVQFFAGYFAFGQVIAYFTAVYRGIVSGISASFVYILLGGKGFFAVLLTVVPFAVTSAAVIILGARETVRQSRQVAEFSFFGNNESNPPDMKLYLIKFAVLVFFSAILSLADSLIAYFPGGIFFTV